MRYFVSMILGKLFTSRLTILFLAGRMHDRIDKVARKVEGQEAAKTRKN